MLTIKTYLDKSTIHGIGVFTSELVSKGQKIWVWEKDLEIIVPHEFLAKLPEPAREYIKGFGYLDKEYGSYVLEFDNARFMNHSDDPAVRLFRNDKGEYVMCAMRDLKPGDEITSDYREFDHEYNFNPDKVKKQAFA